MEGSSGIERPSKRSSPLSASIHTCGVLGVGAICKVDGFVISMAFVVKRTLDELYLSLGPLANGVSGNRGATERIVAVFEYTYEN